MIAYVKLEITNCRMVPFALIGWLSAAGIRLFNVSWTVTLLDNM